MLTGILSKLICAGSIIKLFKKREVYSGLFSHLSITTTTYYLITIATTIYKRQLELETQKFPEELVLYNYLTLLRLQHSTPKSPEKLQLYYAMLPKETDLHFMADAAHFLHHACICIRTGSFMHAALI